MWAIRILTGPQAGQIIPLHQGKNVIGRAPTCEIKINSGSVSKEHAQILVTEDKLIISDMNSRNGTFVNGVRIQNQRLGLGDKISLHDVLLDILQVPANARMGVQMGSHQMSHPASGYAPPPPAWAGNAALRMPNYATSAEADPHGQNAHHELHGQHGNEGYGGHDGHPEMSNMAPPPMSSGGSAVAGNFQSYIDNVAMPGVYAAVKTMPYRYALALLVVAFIFAVTALSTIPMVSVTKKSIQQESVRRAKTIARNLAAINRQAIIEKNDVALTTRAAELEEGVTSVLIISAKDGTIIAPTNKRGEFANKPFVSQARREEREMEGFIDDSNLGVSVPIAYYNSEVGNQSVAAYAIILYDMGALAMNTSRTLSLFIQTLAISLLAGGILFFFLFKIVEHPIQSLNAQLDDALREGRDDLQTEYDFEPLESLASNINSALSRIGRGGGGDSLLSMAVNRDIEASNVVRMLPIAALTVNALDERVIATNTMFDKLIGGGLNLQGRSLTEIPDPALQENLRELLPRMRSSIAEIALSKIPFFGSEYEVCGQAVMGSNEPAYYLITLSQMELG